MPILPVKSFRESFPLLAAGKELYLDSASTTQKPSRVLERLQRFYSEENANVHRGVYRLGQVATSEYEGARKKVASFVHAGSEKEIVFTRGTTESINLVAQSWGRDNVKAGDTILVTRMEHHSNFVPWQSLAREKGARFKIVELDAEGRLDLQELKEILAKDKVRVFAFSWVSNVLGVVNPIRKIAKLAKGAGAMVLVDGAQAIGHIPTSSEDLEHVDFLAFSAHKMYGPTGIGVLRGKEKILKNMKPYQYGGEMISEVRDLLSSWNELPWKFEAGTPNIAGAIGLGEAVDFINEWKLESLHEHEIDVATYFLERLQGVENLRILGPSEMKNRVGVFSFTLDDVHPNDLASYLDQEALCVRVGHHCTQPLHEQLLEKNSMRVSLRAYNDRGDVDRFFEVFSQAVEFFRKRKKTPKKKEKKLDEENLREWIKDVQDPELKMGLVDLGLIYTIKVKNNDNVNVEMTLTSPGCPVAGSIVEEVQSRIKKHPLVKEVKVDLVWDPKWNPKEMASEEAKEVLGIW